MLSVTNCIERLISSAQDHEHQLQISNLELRDALGCVLAEDIYSSVDVPPSDNSAMDGYAISTDDLQSGNTLEISQRIPAGVVPKPLLPGTAARIFTGAHMPDGADTVAMQENCSAHEGFVTIEQPEKPGANVRRRGQDIGKNELVLPKGTSLRAQELSLLASSGCASAPCFDKLTVAIVNTGNELLEPGQPPQPGKIYNSNRILVDSILTGWGFRTKAIDVLADDLNSTKAALEKLSKQADIIISTGGVSVGEEDHIKPAVEALGQLELWKVAIKPGKPFAFGDVRGTPFLGLPGNPASVFVTLLILARPYLLAMQGLSENKLQAKHHKAKAKFSRKPGKREEYLRAKLCGDWLEIHENQSSGVLSSASWGDCFAVQGKGKPVQEGDDIKLYAYDTLLNR